MTIKEVRERWKALCVPDNFTGYFNEDAGVLKVREALDGFRDLSIKKGAKLNYNTNVTHINREEGYVEVDKKRVYAKNIVICCGAYTD